MGAHFVFAANADNFLENTLFPRILTVKCRHKYLILNFILRNLSLFCSYCYLSFFSVWEVGAAPEGRPWCTFSRFFVDVLLIEQMLNG